MARSLKEKYENLNGTEIGIELSKAVKSSNYAKVKFMMEASYIGISRDQIIKSMIRCCINDDLKIFKYFMYKQNIVDFKSKEDILNIIVYASSEITTRIVDYLFDSKKINTNFTEKEIEETMSKISNFESACYVVKKSGLDFNYIIHKDDDAYIKNALTLGNFEIVHALITQYNIDMVPFKDLTHFYSKTNLKEMEIIKLIEKQEFSAKLEKTLDDTDKLSKKMKI